ncbi:MAG TPA: NYN domain-containing protein [Oligoflexus sp.]|uniref:NYN domain-containing protein n=1 Tax=Oligoflexus sp. TaxID=1971216 RepID=UPI002D6A4C68|nr:NYN domain-containing protein [Oligoflexus sp.]HYX33430.1 NYN domain-containing protein [Oligoflexus sp.]
MRAAIFIDGAYVRTQFKMHKIEPDYADMADYFLNPLRTSFPLDLLRCYYYDCAPYMSPEPTEDELKRMEVHKTFVENLLSLGRWAIRLGKLQKRWEGQREYYEQKRVDVLLSVDLVRHAAAGHIQHAVLVAGDSDFVPAVEAAKEHGVTVSLWCGHANTVHRDLISLADEVYTFEWSDFPKLSEESSNPNHHAQKKFKKRRRRGGRGRGGGRPEGTNDDGAMKDPGVTLDSDGKSTWGDRLKKFTGLK